MSQSSRGRPAGRWRDRVKEYMCERGAARGGRLDQARRECLDRERWRLFCRGHTLGGRSWRERGVRAIDKEREGERERRKQNYYLFGTQSPTLSAEILMF